MYNPNSAIERVKNHLAYKLGQAMIEFTNNGGGVYSIIFVFFLSLFKFSCYLYLNYLGFFYLLYLTLLLNFLQTHHF